MAKELANNDEELLSLAKQRFDECAEFFNADRAESLEDIQFCTGDQWDQRDLNNRKLDGRPALTVNKMPQFVSQISNEMRMNKPSVKVNPVDNGADIETAKVLQGVIRNVEDTSNATEAYVKAGEDAVRGGFGFFRVGTEYEAFDSFNQVCKIYPIHNQFGVYLDKDSKAIDGSDSNYGFIFEDKSQIEFKAQYPNAEATMMDNWTSIGDQSHWFTKGSCKVAEYFYKDFKKIQIYQIRDASGQVQVTEKKPVDGMNVQILNQRETLKASVKWIKFNGLEILERGEFPSEYIPIIPVYGRRVFVDGRYKNESLIKYSKDSQRILNYYISNEAEAIGLAPKAPWIIAEGQITKEYAPIWKTANTKAHNYLPYKPTSLNGQPVPAPQRMSFEPAIMALTTARMQANDDIKSTTGIYDASLGAKSNEQSGIAIARRNAQAQTSNYHFIDNLAQSMKHAGRILVDIIPLYYDSERIVRILGEDGSSQSVTINAPYSKGGEMVMHDLSIGRYDVSVEVGPSYETKRQEAASSMIDFLKAVPVQSQYVADLIAKNMDWPQSQEFAERLRKTLPPQLQDDKDKKPIPIEVQQQMQQMGQMVEMLTKKVNEQNDMIKTKQIELESRERIEFAKLEHDAAVQLAKINHAESLAVMQADMALMKQRLELVDINQEFDSEFQESGGNEASATKQNNEQGLEQ